MQLYTVFCTSRAHLASAPNRHETHQLYTPLVIAECRLEGLEFPIEGMTGLLLGPSSCAAYPKDPTS